MTDNEWDAYAQEWDSDPVARAYSTAAFTSLPPVLADHDVDLDGASAGMTRTFVLRDGCHGPERCFGDTEQADLVARGGGQKLGWCDIRAGLAASED